MDMNVGELRLNQLSQRRSFKPSHSQDQSCLNKTDVKPKTRKSSRIPIDFDEEVPLSLLGCTKHASPYRPKKKGAAKHSITAQQIRKQAKEAKIQQTRTTDFDFDAFKASFERLYNYPKVGVEDADDFIEPSATNDDNITELQDG